MERGIGIMVESGIGSCKRGLGRTRLGLCEEGGVDRRALDEALGFPRRLRVAKWPGWAAVLVG